MIGSLIGGAMSLAGSIFGSVKASQAAKKAKKGVERQVSRNDNWRDSRLYEDATQRADAQRVLTQTQEAMRERSRQASGAAAVMGGTEEAAAASKAAGAAAQAEAASQIAAGADARKDAVEAQAQATDQNLQNQLNNIEAGRAASIGQATQGFGAAAGALGQGLSDYFGSTSPATGNDIKGYK